MSLQYSIPVSNARLDAIETSIGASAILKLWTGSIPADCDAADTGTKLAEFDLGAVWASPASAGAMVLTSLPLTGASIGDGILGYFRIYASDGVTCHIQGSISETGDGGDLTFDNTNVANLQAISINGFTIDDA